MNWITIQLIILAFGIGLLLGSVISFFTMRRLFHRNFKMLSRYFRILSARNISAEGENDERRDVLLLLAEKLKQIEDNIKKIRQKEFNNYINDLNRLLDQTGIAQIDKKIDNKNNKKD